MPYITRFISAPCFPPNNLVSKRFERQLKGDEFAQMIEAAIQEKASEGYELFHLEILNSMSKSVLHKGFRSTEGALITFRRRKG